MNFHQVPAFHPLDAIPPVIIAGLYIVASSLIGEPSRRNFNAIMIGGAGAAYLGGAFGVWEFAFTEVVTFVRIMVFSPIASSQSVGCSQ